MIPPEVETWGNAFFGSEDSWSASRQSGGINNHVFLCDDGKEKVVAKHYPNRSEHQPDRFNAESEFLTYANLCAAEYVPDLVSIDSDKRILVMQYMDGSVYSDAQDLRLRDIQCAAEFISKLLENTKLAKSHLSQSATDGFLTLSGHLKNVEKRLSEMSTSHLPASCQIEAKETLAQINGLFGQVRAHLLEAIESGIVLDRVDDLMLCPSPSDFGFHNAIVNAEGVKFIDFEFSGWDDPAKLVCDFFLQPRIRVPTEYIGLMEEAVASVIPGDVLRTRIKYLMPALHLKWASIILAVLRPNRLKSLIDVNPEEPEQELIERRLKAARHYMKDEIRDGLR